jgi:hypothetical protein
VEQAEAGEEAVEDSHGRGGIEVVKVKVFGCKQWMFL